MSEWDLLEVEALQAEARDLRDEYMPMPHGPERLALAQRAHDAVILSRMVLREGLAAGSIHRRY